MRLTQGDGKIETETGSETRKRREDGLGYPTEDDRFVDGLRRRAMVAPLLRDGPMNATSFIA
jgi:hypothetical protein